MKRKPAEKSNRSESWNNLEERKVKMVWMRFWCDACDGSGGAVAHAAFTLQSEPLGCNPVITVSFLFTFLFGVPSATQPNPSHIPYSLSSTRIHKHIQFRMIRIECCEAFGFAHAANLLLLVCDAPITSNTRVNIYNSSRDAHAFTFGKTRNGIL